MPQRIRVSPRVVLAFAMMLLGACTQTKLVVHTVKKLQGDDSAATGTYKVGAPYAIDGVWYYPSEDDDYTEIGVASWYGEDFHGKSTANGEDYDMEAMTAAHRTLPMPSAVRVTNLDNGRTVTLRVNDRGPFVDNRIIDVSRRAAQVLGFERRGTARVHVEILPDESRLLKLAALNSPAGKAEQVQVAAAPTVAVRTTPVAAVMPVVANRRATVRPVEPQLAALPVAASMPEAPVIPATASDSIYVQVGAFSQFSNALAMRDRIAALGPALISRYDRPTAPLYRVRLGPLATVSDAEMIRARAMSAGAGDARIIHDPMGCTTAC